MSRKGPFVPIDSLSSGEAMIFHSHALLACFRGEPTGLQVRDLLDQAAAADRPMRMAKVNYAEAKCMILRKDGPQAWQEAENVVSGLPLEFRPADRALADLAAEFKARISFSLGDALAALAKKVKAELVTGDREFKAVENEIKIDWLK